MTPAPPAVRVRPMRLQDLDRIIEIARELETAPLWPRSAYERLLSQPGRVTLVAAEDEGGAIAGFAVAVLVPPEAEIETVAVRLPSQKRGMGRALLEGVAAEIRTRGITLVHLEVRASNQPALALYRRVGFTECGRRSGYYADPIEDAIILSLDLAAREAAVEGQ
jgi:ribosomal-protein-alanine N-acetyltransferase